MILVVSASLHPRSRSRLLAQAACQRLEKLERPYELLDLNEHPLPLCDGDAAYGDPAVGRAIELGNDATAILLAAPVYNYDVNAAAKNLVELTGRSWTGKVVGMLLAAGGQGSYMSGMGLANSLMLDFRCLVVPRFVYAVGDAFEGDQITDENALVRLDQLVEETLRISDAVRAAEPKKENS
ncbi:NADPH-dependent FMN reductase [Roseimaritima ulvae]|uniref:NAD(P)H-dependent FAD/FMN reductase n=1 Tax=Roseimaritima ulvae TaxID=980254 RepID=A0A5B9QU95_9BACT|nr:NAD(P)H-dependent oxidoreductase [Roseimaritima ulvae]QEG42627.1 NAD(P)H-dependent FAD/FMN reductase [Roseimaritima ulvae]